MPSSSPPHVNVCSDDRQRRRRHSKTRGVRRAQNSHTRLYCAFCLLLTSSRRCRNGLRSLPFHAAAVITIAIAVAVAVVVKRQRRSAREQTTSSARAVVIEQRRRRHRRRCRRCRRSLACQRCHSLTSPTPLQIAESRRARFLHPACYHFLHSRARLSPPISERLQQQRQTSNKQQQAAASSSEQQRAAAMSKRQKDE